jgi:hypothetical protein
MKSNSNKKPYDPEKVLDRIIEIERKFPVNEWKIQGIEVWPMIRNSLAYTQRDLSYKTKQMKSSSVKRLLQYVRMLVYLPFQTLVLRSQLKSAKRIFLGAVTHRTTINRKKVNKYFDVAIEDFFKQGDTSIILDRGTSLDKSEYPNKGVWFSLPLLYVLTEARKRFAMGREPDYNFDLSQYDDFYNYIVNNFENPHILKTSFSIHAIKKRMADFYERKELLKSYLSKSRIEHVYFLCYYSSLFYPFIAACNELGIKTTDVQHGGMGPGHFAYDRWTSVPKKGYTLLPRNFWTWDNHSQDLINGWALNSTFHRAFSMGTPWINDLSKLSVYEPAVKDYVLFNMTDEILPSYVVSAMMHFGEKRPWVLRMHPRQLKKRRILQHQIDTYRLQSFVTIENSTEILLNDSLKFSAAFISASSGSIIEGISMGIKPILLPSPGFNYYKHYFTSGILLPLFEENDKALISLLDISLRGQRNTSVSLNNRSAAVFISFEKKLAELM